MIEAGLGRFGPYVKMGAIFGTLDADDDVLTVGLNRAIDSLAKKMASIRTLGAHPKDGEAVMIRKGRFGPYVQHGQVVANLAKGQSMDDVSLEEALALLLEKGKPLKAKGKATRKSSSKASPSDSSADKAAPKKKATAKTASTKKPDAKKQRVPERRAKRRQPRRKQQRNLQKPRQQMVMISSDKRF